MFSSLDNNNYKVLEPDYIKINKDFPETVIDKVIEEDSELVVKNINDIDESRDCFNQNVNISISDRKLTSNNSVSNLSDSSFLNSSNNSFFYEDNGFEKIEINRPNSMSPFDDSKLIDKLREFTKNNKNALLISDSNGKNIFIEIKPNYKEICFNDLLDIVTSVESNYS